MGSPFDYRAHALLYVARHLPDRRAAGAEDALHEELARLIEAAGGRTLALFTSRRATEAAAEALAPELPFTAPAPGRPAQGPPARGLRRGRDLLPLRHAGFLAGRRHPGGPSRWSPSTACRSPAPTTRCSRPAATGPAARPSAGRPAPGGDAAGPGRGPAIRTADDRGVVAVLDPAWPRRRTGACCCRPCPPCGARSIAEVEVFLRRALEDGGP